MIGQQVGNYRVLSLLGQGGMGEVYLAEHGTIGTRVAIKVLQAVISQDQDQVDRFFNEAKAVSRVRHAGPVKIFDCGYHESNGQRVAYLAMEFLDGESLAARIRRLGTLPGEHVADIGRQIAGVLDAVHTAGITHRDLKPDNIFLVPDLELPSGERVKVLDFGIAKLSGTMAGPQTKGTMGTPAYMAPEQWTNTSAVDGKADTYSLGCVMFEMAVGKPPFPAQSIGEACNHHLHTPPPRASALLQSIPPEFDTLVERMLSKTVDHRPTVKEVARAFETLRSSGATQRWQAASVSGISPIPESVLGAQPTLGLGSQPALVLQPTPQHPSQPHVAQTTPGAAVADAHTTPVSKHHAPKSGSSRMLVIGLGAVVLVGGGIATAVVVTGGSTSEPAGEPLAPSDKPADNPAGNPPDNPTSKIAGTPEGAGSTVKPTPSKREQILTANPFVERNGVRVLSTQITAAEYERVLGTLPDGVTRPADPQKPVASLTQKEAAAFCAAIDAQLPTSDEWEQAARGAWGIAVDTVTGPLQEWTSTISDSLVVVRGGHATMAPAQLDRGARSKPPHFGQKEVAGATFDRNVVSSTTIGFRCVDGTSSAKPSSAGPVVAANGTKSPDNRSSGSYRMVPPSGKKPPGGGDGEVESNSRSSGSYRMVLPDKKPPTDDAGDEAEPNGRSSGSYRMVLPDKKPPSDGAGELPKPVIKDVIGRQLPKIKYCYEKVLLDKPDLQGTVTVNFVIGPNGKVRSARASGLDPAVARCIEQIFMSLEFPAPDPAGSVSVTYPFTFKSSN